MFEWLLLLFLFWVWFVIGTFGGDRLDLCAFVAYGLYSGTPARFDLLVSWV